MISDDVVAHTGFYGRPESASGRQNWPGLGLAWSFLALWVLDGSGVRLPYRGTVGSTDLPAGELGACFSQRKDSFSVRITMIILLLPLALPGGAGEESLLRLDL